MIAWRYLPTALLLAYPFLVYVGVGSIPASGFAIMLFLVALVRMGVAARPVWRDAFSVASFAGAAGVSSTFFIDSAVAVRIYPVIVNGVLAIAFGLSLLRPPSMIERLARLREPGLDAAGIRYTRRLTQVWLGFFLVNGAVSIVTVLSDELWLWTIYNGLIAYLLIGTVFFGEMLLRPWFRRVSS